MMKRDGVNLTRHTDGQLAALVASVICLGVDATEIGETALSLPRARHWVRMAAAAFDLLQAKLTVAHVQSPSDESRAWSSLEGGHIWHELPNISVRNLITGHI